MHPKAETYEELSWRTGKLRLRCRGCGKVAFPDAISAMASARKIKEKYPETFMRATFNGVCGHWHIKGKRRYNV